MEPALCRFAGARKNKAWQSFPPMLLGPLVDFRDDQWYKIKVRLAPPSTHYTAACLFQNGYLLRRVKSSFQRFCCMHNG
jgi:hypothetical protein